MKRICFFTAGFAFNRLNRMKFYEKALPKGTKIYLFTTDRWEGKEKQSYQFKWEGLSRTKIFTAKYNLKLPFTLRKFLRVNKIDRIINIGNRASVPLFWFGSILTKTKYLFNMMGWVPREHKLIKKPNLKEFWDLIFFYIFGIFSKNVTSVDYGVYKWFNQRDRSPISRLFISKNKVVYLPVPVNTDIFKPKNKITCRKKLRLPKNKKIVIFVGRVNYTKGADILYDLIKKNPDILFIVIGRLMDDKFRALKSKNFLLFEKKSAKELVDYYGAADISFLLHRIKGGGLGLTAEESLACGVPVIGPDREKIQKTPAFYQIPHNVNISKKVLNEFFTKSPNEKKKLSRLAREYALKNYSHDVWKKPHENIYIN